MMLGPFVLDRVYQGDCLELMKELPDGCVDLVLTDPPYGINYQSARRSKPERFEHVHNDEKINIDWLREIKRLIKPTGAFLFFCRWDTYPECKNGLKGWNIKSLIVWDRGIHGMGDLKQGYAPSHDFIIYCINQSHYLRGNRPKDIIKFQRISGNDLVHPTEKPIELMEFFIRNHTDADNVVLDPFIGSGTTAVAAKRLNRRFLGFEINPEYVAIAERRLAKVSRKLEEFL